MSLQIFLDLAVVALLTATIIAAIRVNRKFAAFRVARDEFEQTVERFNAAAARAEAGVAALKGASDDAGRSLQQSVAKAHALRDDLNFLVERGEPIVDRLIAANNRPAPKAEPAAAPRAARPKPEPKPEPRRPVAPATGGDSDLLKSLSALR